MTRDIHDLYKPFRNRIRETNLWTGLMSVFAYSQFIQGEMNLPALLMTPRLRSVEEPWQAGLFPWALELLARELILHGQSRTGTRLTDGASVFAFLATINDLENEAWRIHDGEGNAVFLEMSRIAYRQFHWQAGVTTDDLARYYLMFGTPELATAIESEFGLTVVELFQLILLVRNEMIQQPMLQLTFTRVALPAVLPALDALASRLAKSLDEMRALTADVQRYDVNWAYTFNPLREFPLIHMGNERSMLCPIPYLLTRRLTDGVYYDLIRRSDNAVSLFGNAFEAFVGRAARKELGDRATIFDDQVYGTPEKRSIDWIIQDESAALFVECKLARPDLKAQTVISDRDPFGAALKRLGDAVVQVYATLTDALAGDYLHWKSDGRPTFPLIVTLAEWHAFGPYFGRTLQTHVDAGFSRRGIDRTLLERCPYTICSVTEFEGMLSVLRTVRIDEVMAGKTGSEHRDWMVGPYLNHRFPAETERPAALFDQELRDVIYAPSRFTRVGQGST